MLAATFNVHIDDLPDFPFTNSDPLIVGRVNPLDPGYKALDTCLTSSFEARG